MTQYIGVGRYQKPQTAAVSGTTASFTNAVSSEVYKVQLGATVDICFRQGVGAQTAVTTDNVIFASNPLHITVQGGETIAVIARDGTSTGTAYLSEVV
jgi:hypothetical protein